MAHVQAFRQIVSRFNKAQDDLVLQAADLSLETIANMVDSNAIDVSPKYQQRDRWTADKQRSLVESFLLNVPIPPVYLFEEEYGTYSVIYGKKRIVAIRSFMRDDLDLRNLKSFKKLDGLRFSQMPLPVQNALRVRPYLRVVTLLRQSSQYLKYEVFRRLNEGGEPLNPQEIRNVVYMGPMNALVYKLSERPFLLRQMKIRSKKEPPYRQMFNAEVVLRFFVRSDTWKHFSGSFRDSLDYFMRMQQSADKITLERYEARFIRAIEACEKLFGEVAFKRPAQDGWRDQFQIGMFDAQMVGLSETDDATIEANVSRKREIRDSIKDMFRKDKEFESAVREATNTPSRIRYRIQQMEMMLLF